VGRKTSEYSSQRRRTTANNKMSGKMNSENRKKIVLLYFLTFSNLCNRSSGKRNKRMDDVANCHWSVLKESVRECDISTFHHTLLISDTMSCNTYANHTYFASVVIPL
jgi:hypothetical protein